MTDDGTLPPFIKKHPQGWAIQVMAAPRAKRSAFVGLHGGIPRISVAAPPADGRANQELTRFMAEYLGVSKQSIQLLRGDTSKHKTLIVSGVSSDDIVRAFRETP